MHKSGSDDDNWTRGDTNRDLCVRETSCALTTSSLERIRNANAHKSGALSAAHNCRQFVATKCDTDAKKHMSSAKSHSARSKKMFQGEFMLEDIRRREKRIGQIRCSHIFVIDEAGDFSDGFFSAKQRCRKQLLKRLQRSNGATCSRSDWIPGVPIFCPFSCSAT